MGLSNIHVDVLWKIFLQFKSVHKNLKNLYICTDFQFYSVVLAIEDYVNIVETLCRLYPLYVRHAIKCWVGSGNTMQTLLNEFCCQVGDFA